jgi:hypothetical protein
MGRIAGFLDAGYVLAGAHDLLGGPVTRSAFACGYDTLLPAIQAEIVGHAGAADLTYLRTYWYDGARNGLPTADHRRIGSLPFVKVRLGRLNQRGQQKGVDGLIYRDLTNLARAAAIERAYVFTGDEDIREGVVTAQDLGVQVVLMSYHPTRQTGRSAALVREVDDMLVLDRPFWEPHFTRQESTIPATSGPPDVEKLEKCGVEFAEKWAKDATEEEVRTLIHRAPNMPRDMYVQLVLAAEKEVGSLRTEPSAKGDLRKAFWKALKKVHKEEESEAEAGAEAG